MRSNLHYLNFLSNFAGKKEEPGVLPGKPTYPNQD
jgi:hypothetical protein